MWPLVSDNKRSNYIESNQFGPKKLSGIRNREDPVFRVFYHIKYRREKFGTDEIVRFHGDSGIKRIRFRGVLLYIQPKLFDERRFATNDGHRPVTIFHPGHFVKATICVYNECRNKWWTMSYSCLSFIKRDFQVVIKSSLAHNWFNIRTKAKQMTVRPTEKKPYFWYQGFVEIQNCNSELWCTSIFYCEF